MRLTIAIPETQMVEAPALLRLVRMAPACDVEAGEQVALYVARFDDFLTSVEVVARLIEETWDLRGIRITLEGRQIVRRVNFYVALRCYHQSLGAPDAAAYCLQQSAKVGAGRGCPDRSCASHCQFICSQCVGVARDQGMQLVPMQLLEIARYAELDWCPNLHIAREDT